MTTITIERELLERAKDALIESVDLVRHDYENDWRHGVPTRKAQLEGSRLALEAHEKVIHDISAALAAPATAPEHLEWPEFEPWAQYVGMNVSKDADGYYTSETTDMAWQAWEMAKNQKMTVSPPATAPAQPSWQDAPTVPGLWLAKSSGIVRLVDEHDIEHLQKYGLPRWFGPIQEDKQ